MKLNSKQKQIHERAKLIAIEYQRAEIEMIQVLHEADQIRLHKCFGLSSLFKYAVEQLKVSEPVALMLIAVARKAAEVSALKAAIVEGRLSASTANRLVSTINTDNADELIEFAATHSWRETERELARRNPRAVTRETIKPLGNGLVEIKLVVTEAQSKEFERSCSIEAQRKQSVPKNSEVFMATVRAYNDKYDPVQKAQRAKKRADRVVFKSVHTERARPSGENSGFTDVGQQSSSEDSERADKTPPENSVRTDHFVREKYTAEQIHAVNLRDRRCCTFLDPAGNRCNQDRWTEIHHIIPVSRGGTNDIENLTTLCWHHRDMIHQLSLPIEGQFNYFR